MTDRQLIQECILNTAQYYGRALTGSVVAMMADDLAGYPAESVLEAFARYRRNGKNRFFPLPAQIIEVLEGGTSARSSASALALRLIGAIKIHDYTWPQMTQPKFYKRGSFEADFRAELGDVAWDVVQMAGGWARFCGSFYDSGNETAFLAQIRDAIEHVVDSRRGDVLALPRRDPHAELEAPPAGDEPSARLMGLVRGITGRGEGA